MQEEYIKRINHVLTFVDENLDTELSLHTVSNVACYSPFHLHRLFKAVTNETLNSYVTRKRVERAVIMLIHNKEYSITEISGKCGFDSDSSFSRTFKKLYGQSPSTFRKANLNTFSKIGNENSKIGKVNYITEEYICNINALKNWIKLNANITIAVLPKMHFAYITQIGERGVENVFQRIIKWAASKRLLENGNGHVCRVFHDSLKVTDSKKVRMSIGICTEQLVSSKGEVGATTIDAGKTVVGRFIIEPIEFEKAWSSLFIWMSEKGYKTSGKRPFEIYHNLYTEHPEKKCVVDMCIPIDTAI